MSKIVEYVMICQDAEHQKIAALVNAFIKDGFQLFGSPCASANANCVHLYQAMVKYEAPKSDTVTEL